MERAGVEFQRRLPGLAGRRSRVHTCLLVAEKLLVVHRSEPEQRHSASTVQQKDSESHTSNVKCPSDHVWEK